MVNQITLTNTSLSTTTAVKLFNGKFTYGWKNLFQVDPSNSAYGNVEAQFSGWENPLITLNFFIPIDDTPAGFMTWSLWNEFVKYQYDGVTQTILQVSVGSGDTAFADYSADSTTSADTTIPVVVRNYNLTFSPRDSNNANFWKVSVALQVTK